MYRAEYADSSDVCENQRIKNLYAAVMGRAVNDLLRPGSDYDSAVEWFNHGPAPITFRDCCSALNLNHKAVLIALQSKGLLQCEEPQKRQA